MSNKSVGSVQKKLEEKMDKYLVKNAPFQIPKDGKQSIVQWAPWIVLVVGILSILSSISLWKLARETDKLVDYGYDLSQAYGIESTVRDVSFMVYFSIIVVALQGLIYLTAYSGLRAKSKKRGWDLLLLSTLLGLVYGISILFIPDYRTVLDFAFSVFVAIVGLFVLAQIKTYYKDEKPLVKHSKVVRMR